MVAIKDTQVGKLGPWLEAFIDAHKESNVLFVIRAHPAPRLHIAVHTSTPQGGAGIRYFPPTAKVTAEIIKLIAVEFKRAPSDLQGIYCLERGRWVESMDSKAGVDLLNIKGVPIVGNNDIRGI